MQVQRKRFVSVALSLLIVAAFTLAVSSSDSHAAKKKLGKKEIAELVVDCVRSAQTRTQSIDKRKPGPHHLWVNAQMQLFSVEATAHGKAWKDALKDVRKWGEDIDNVDSTALKEFSAHALMRESADFVKASGNELDISYDVRLAIMLADPKSGNLYKRLKLIRESDPYEEIKDGTENFVAAMKLVTISEKCLEELIKKIRHKDTPAMFKDQIARAIARYYPEDPLTKDQVIEDADEFKGAIKERAKYFKTFARSAPDPIQHFGWGQIPKNPIRYGTNIKVAGEDIMGFRLDNFAKIQKAPIDRKHNIKVRFLPIKGDGFIFALTTSTSAVNPKWRRDGKKSKMVFEIKDSSNREYEIKSADEWVELEFRVDPMGGPNNSTVVNVLVDGKNYISSWTIEGTLSAFVIGANKGELLVGGLEYSWSDIQEK